MKAVFFDLAGTLISINGGIGAQYAAVAHEFGVEADPEAIDAAFPVVFRDAGAMELPHADAPEVASLEKDFWRRVVRQVFDRTGFLARFPPGQFDQYFERLFRYLATSGGWTVFPDVQPALDRLKRKGLVVGLVTNFDFRVFPLVESLGLAPLIDSITIPSIAGAAKPERRIFEHALARHGLEAGDAMMVGDSLSDDVEGGRAAGMQAVLVDRNGRHRDRIQAPGVAVVASLDELAPMS